MIALARKYRPKQFADLIVQDHVAAALRGAVAQGRVALDTDAPAIVRVTVQDAYGNDVPVSEVQAAPADRAVVRVLEVVTDSAGGAIRLRPGSAGSTGLVVVASHVRTDLSVVVRTNHGPEVPRCS